MSIVQSFSSSDSSVSHVKPHTNGSCGNNFFTSKGWYFLIFLGQWVEAANRVQQVSSPVQVTSFQGTHVTDQRGERRHVIVSRDPVQSHTHGNARWKLKRRWLNVKLQANVSRRQEWRREGEGYTSKKKREVRGGSKIVLKLNNRREREIIFQLILQVLLSIVCVEC